MNGVRGGGVGGGQEEGLGGEERRKTVVRIKDKYINTIENDDRKVDISELLKILT